jgi:drug/metabolite transporter (DMT)-like permease
MLGARPRLAAIIGVFTISWSALIIRAADTAPVTVALYRALYSLPVLLPAWYLLRRRDQRSWRRRWLAFASGVLLAIDLAFWHTAIDRIGAGLATVLVATQVIFVAMIAWAAHDERPSVTAFALVPVIFGGVVLLSGLGGSDAYGDDPWAGVIFGVSGGLFYGLFILTLRASNRGVLAPTAAPILDSTVGVLAGSVLIGMLTPADMPVSLEADTHWWLLLMAVSSQLIGWPLINVALPRLAALETSVLVLAQPMLTVIWALLIYDEDLSTIQWLGVVLVLGGLLVLNLRGAVARGEPAPEPAPAPDIPLGSARDGRY